MPKKQNRDVVPSTGGGWDVKKSGSKQPISHHKTQANAEKREKRDVAKKGAGEVRIHGRDGRFRDSDTIPPAKDPNPPRDGKH